MVVLNKTHLIIVICFMIFVSVVSLFVSLLSSRHSNVTTVQNVGKPIEEQTSDLRHLGRDIDSNEVSEDDSSDDNGHKSSNKTRRFLFAYFSEKKQKGIMVYNRFKRNTCYKIDPIIDVKSLDTFGSSVLLFNDTKCQGHIRNVSKKVDDVTRYHAAICKEGMSDYDCRYHHGDGDYESKLEIKSFKCIDNLNLFVVDLFPRTHFKGDRTRLYLTKGVCHNLTVGTIANGLGHDPSFERPTTQPSFASYSADPIESGSIHTHVNCIYTFDQLDCSGEMAIMEPRSRHHDDLEELTKSDGVWANKILSIKSCNGDHNDVAPGDDYEDY